MSDEAHRQPDQRTVIWHELCAQMAMLATIDHQNTAEAIKVRPRPAPAGRIVLLMADGPLAWSIANRLKSRFHHVTIIQEQPETKSVILQRRARILGWRVALGQAACGVLLRLLEPTAAGRREAICYAAGLDPRPDPGHEVHRVQSVNSDAC